MPKENNNNKGAKRWPVLFLTFVGAVSLVIYLVITTTKSHIKSIGHHVTTLEKHSDGRFSPQEHQILSGTYYLMDLGMGSLPAKGIAYNIMGTFCPLDWHLQKSNPSTVPMFRDLVAQSVHCQRNSIKMDLRKMATKARLLDAAGGTTTHALKLSGVVFHETRCGSTLVANLLAGFSPETNRVYSESGPPVTALRMCDGVATCNAPAHDALVRDVFYMMGRSNNPREKHVFFKIQSVGVRSIDVFTRVFSQTPWLFVYRDGVEIVMSHLKSKDQPDAVCLRSRNRPPAMLRDLVQAAGKELKSLSSTEFCAAHLASLCQAALTEHTKNPERAKFVNYATLPEVMWESVLPGHFGIDVNSAEIERMTNVASVYSKGRGPKANREWESDSQKKQDKAWEQIRSAVELFVRGPFDKMEELSHAAVQ